MALVPPAFEWAIPAAAIFGVTWGKSADVAAMLDRHGRYLSFTSDGLFLGIGTILAAVSIAIDVAKIILGGYATVVTEPSWAFVTIGFLAAVGGVTVPIFTFAYARIIGYRVKYPNATGESPEDFLDRLRETSQAPTEATVYPVEVIDSVAGQMAADGRVEVVDVAKGAFGLDQGTMRLDVRLRGDLDG